MPAPSRPLHRARAPGWSVCMVHGAPAVARHSSLHPSGRMQGRLPWAEGDESMGSQDKWLLDLWRRLGMISYIMKRGGGRHRQQACVPNVGAGRCLFWPLWGMVLSAYMSATLETENPEFVVLTGPQSCTPRDSHSSNYANLLSLFALAVPYFWSAPPLLLSLVKFHSSFQSSQGCHHLRGILSDTPRHDGSFFPLLSNSIRARCHHSPYTTHDTVLKLHELLFSHSLPYLHLNPQHLETVLNGGPCERRRDHTPTSSLTHGKIGENKPCRQWPYFDPSLLDGAKEL